MTAILDANCLTGQALTWDELLASGQDICPSQLALGQLAVPAVPMPGQTQLKRSFVEGW